jgi:hypothetical protein
MLKNTCAALVRIRCFLHHCRPRYDQASASARMTELQLSSPVQGLSYFKLRAGRTETLGLSGLVMSTVMQMFNGYGE